jgi:hypothetical protein
MYKLLRNRRSVLGVLLWLGLSPTGTLAGTIEADSWNCPNGAVVQAYEETRDTKATAGDMVLMTSIGQLNADSAPLGDVSRKASLFSPASAQAAFNAPKAKKSVVLTQLQIDELTVLLLDGASPSQTALTMQALQVAVYEIDFASPNSDGTYTATSGKGLFFGSSSVEASEDEGVSSRRDEGYEDHESAYDNDIGPALSVAQRFQSDVTAYQSGRIVPGASLQLSPAASLRYTGVGLAHASLATAAPEPSCTTVFLVGLAVLFRVRRRGVLSLGCGAKPG